MNISLKALHNNSVCDYFLKAVLTIKRLGDGGGGDGGFNLTLPVVFQKMYHLEKG